MDEEMRYKRKSVMWWVLVATVVLSTGAVIWWDASETREFDARHEALIESLIEADRKLRAVDARLEAVKENQRKTGARLEELTAKVEEMEQRVGLDGVELSDPAQPLGCSLRAGALEDVAQLGLGVTPTVGWSHPSLCLSEPGVTGVAVDLQDAFEPVECR